MTRNQELEREYAFEYLDTAVRPQDLDSVHLQFMGVKVDRSWPVDKLFQLIHVMGHKLTPMDRL